MFQRVTHLAVPAYLASCIVLGGSAQLTWNILVLKLAAILLLAWAALSPSALTPSSSSRPLAYLLAATVLLILLQLTPLPASVWSAFPGRESVISGFRLMGEKLPWLPLTLTPAETISASLTPLTPVAVLAGVVRLGAYRAGWVASAIVLATLAAVLLGAMQVATGSGYLYSFTSRGQAAGFFANANYMGTLLLAAIPFLTALLARIRKEPGRQRRLGLTIACGAGLATLLLGLGLNQSAAALLLSGPVILASGALLIMKTSRLRSIVLGGALGTLAAGCLALAWLPTFATGNNAISVSTRQQIYANTLRAAEDAFPVGTGLGSFPQIYPLYEDPDSVDYVYVNHAHNDYLEIVLETGLVGLILIIVFAGWWSRRVFRIWREEGATSMARAATIASAAILAHSVVDFPARTTAIAAVLAAAVALMAEPRSQHLQAKSQIRSRPAKHLKLR